MLSSGITSDLPFCTAAEIYMRIRSVAATPGAISARYMKENTEIDYQRKIKSCNLFFGTMPLKDIHWYNMRAYQQARINGDEPFVRYRRPQDAKVRNVGGIVIPAKGKTPCRAKPQQVNQELRLVKKLKTLAGCWTADDEAYFEPLQEEESDVERALTADQQNRWIEVARLNPRWELILWWSIVSFDLLTSTNELRGLQLGNINMHYQEVRIPWPCAKNRYRHRDIPVEDPQVLWALDRLIARAHDMGSRDPQHYLFPFKVTRSKQAYPDRPMTESGIKKLWQEVREATGILWFRPYDTRHTGATRRAEQGWTVPMLMARMGHCSPDMQRRYTHISQQAQRLWLRGAHSMQPPRFQPQPERPQWQQGWQNGQQRY